MVIYDDHPLSYQSDQGGKKRSPKRSDKKCTVFSCLNVKLPWIPRGFWEDPQSRTNGTVVLSGQATSAHHHAQENHPSISMGISISKFGWIFRGKLWFLLVKFQSLQKLARSLLKPLPSSVDSLPLTNGSLKMGCLLPNDDLNYTFQ